MKPTVFRQPKFSVGDLLWVRQSVYNKHYSDGGKEIGIVVKTTKIIGIEAHSKKRNQKQVDYIKYQTEEINGWGVIREVKKEYTWYGEKDLYTTFMDAMQADDYPSRIYGYETLEKNLKENA